jgi:hypothetical protein
LVPVKNHHLNDNESSPYIATYIRYACDNVYDVQHEEQCYSRPHRRMVMALSKFVMSKLHTQNYYNLNSSMKPSPAWYYIITQLLKKNSPHLMGPKVHSCIHNSLQLDPVLSGNKPVNILKFCILKTEQTIS